MPDSSPDSPEELSSKLSSEIFKIIGSPDNEANKPLADKLAKSIIDITNNPNDKEIIKAYNNAVNDLKNKFEEAAIIKLRPVVEMVKKTLPMADNPKVKEILDNSLGSESRYQSYTKVYPGVSESFKRSNVQNHEAGHDLAAAIVDVTTNYNDETVKAYNDIVNKLSAEIPDFKKSILEPVLKAAQKNFFPSESDIQKLPVTERNVQRLSSVIKPSTQKKIYETLEEPLKQEPTKQELDLIKAQQDTASPKQTKETSPQQKPTEQNLKQDTVPTTNTPASIITAPLPDVQKASEVPSVKTTVKKEDIIAKYSTQPSNGTWQQAMENSHIKDPVAYAAANDIKIEGKNALQWAHENNYTVVRPAAEVGLGGLRKGEVAKNVAETQGSIDPAYYLSKKNESVGTTTPSNTEKEFQHQATKYGLDDANGNPYKQDPKYSDSKLEEEFNKKNQIIADRIGNLTSDFLKKNNRINVTKEQVTKLYDNVLQELKKENLITDKDVEAIKNNKRFNDSIETTTQSLNGNHGRELTASKLDRVTYHVAEFCEKTLGLKKLSNIIKSKIPAESLSKINHFEYTRRITAGIRNAFKDSNNNKKTITSERLNEIANLNDPALKSSKKPLKSSIATPLGKSSKKNSSIGR